MSSSVSESAAILARRKAKSLMRNREDRRFKRVHNEKFRLAEIASRKRYLKKRKLFNKLAMQFVKENQEQFNAWLKVKVAPQPKAAPRIPTPTYRVQLPKPPDLSSPNILEQIGFQ
jgi:hypothetical protein